MGGDDDGMGVAGWRLEREGAWVRWGGGGVCGGVEVWGLMECVCMADCNSIAFSLPPLIDNDIN